MQGPPPNRTQSPGPSRMNCFFCKKPGHSYQDCRSLNEAKAFLNKMRFPRQSRPPFRSPNRNFRQNSRSNSGSRRDSRSPGRNVSFAPNRTMNSVTVEEKEFVAADDSLWNDFLDENHE